MNGSRAASARDRSVKRLYSVKEFYWIAYDAFRTMRRTGRAKKAGDLGPKFIRRIMLAVTEVNDCQLCSYAHTRMALEDGMSEAEIKGMLEGTLEGVPEEQVAAMMFVQHYAESRGRPSEGSWARIVELYGTETAQGILGAVRMITMGNAFGIAYGSFVNRFRGRADPRSSLGYESLMVLGSMFMMPVALAHALLSLTLKRPLISFEN